MIVTERQLSSGLSKVEAPRFNWRELISALTQERVSMTLILCTHDLIVSSAPADGVQLKIWTCYANLPAQQWVYTADYRIALEGKGKFPSRCTSTMSMTNIYRVLHGFREGHYDEWQQGADLDVYRQQSQPDLDTLSAFSAARLKFEGPKLQPLFRFSELSILCLP